MAMVTPQTEVATDGKGLICAVCRDIYRSPRILPCFHTFCLYCLEDISRAKGGQNFPCPTCRKPTAVPAGGSLGFQVNFYITEKELEAARNGPGSTTCPQPGHQTNHLEYFCVPCDTAICITCKLTKHERHHETLELSAAAVICRDQLEVSKDRLEQAVNVLSKKSAQAYENLNAAEKKGNEIKAVIQVKRDVLIARVRQRCDIALKQVDCSNSTIKQQLSTDARTIHQEFDTLLQLQQSIHHGLSSSASHAEVVSAEKEMRKGQGSTARLEQVVSSCFPATSLRPGLRPDHSSCSDSDIDRCLGVPMVLTLPFDAKPEVIMPIYQCGQDRACRQVHSLCHVTDNKIYISFGGTLPDYTGETVVKITDQGAEDMKYRLPAKAENGKVTYLYHISNPDIVKCTPLRKDEDGDEINYLNAKGGVWMLAECKPRSRYVYKVKCKSESPVHCEKTFQAIFCGGTTVAFDTTQDEQLFAFVGTTAEHTQNTVLLFHGKKYSPSAVYRPAVSGFHPTDVCFWREDEQGEKLLVADEHNDAVHVVSVENNQCRFERYLTAGNGLLVRPTALNVDRHNRVWIGCGNGRILRCDQARAVQVIKKTAGDDTQSHADSSEVGQLTVGNASEATDVLSQATCANNSEMDQLAVRNPSEATDVQSHLEPLSQWFI